MSVSSKITVKQWEALTLPVNFSEDETWNDVDISWATIYFTVRKRKDLHDSDDTDVLIKKTINVPESPATSSIDLVLTADDTKKESWLHDWEFVIKFGTDDIRISKDYWEFEIKRALTREI